MEPMTNGFGPHVTKVEVTTGIHVTKVYFDPEAVPMIEASKTTPGATVINCGSSFLPPRPRAPAYRPSDGRKPATNGRSASQGKDAVRAKPANKPPAGRPISTQAPSTPRDSGGSAVDKTCPLCMNSLADPQMLVCGHQFCGECVELVLGFFAESIVCPVCQRDCGRLYGDQPEDGKMRVSRAGNRLPGHPDSDGTIVITYTFPDGIQQAHHPDPGEPYHGIERNAYLPDSREGNEVLELLRRAFDARLTFTIKRTLATGGENQVTWNDVSHKTSTSGGVAGRGYPDEGYLSAVKEQLAAKGIR